MANVKFYRLGENQGVSKETYNRYCKVAGAIVFAKIKEENGSLSDSSTLVPPSYYIWANGIEYKVANADVLNYIFNLVTTNDATVEGSVAKRIADALDEYKPKAEDIAELIDASSNVKVEVVDSSLRLTVEARKATITEGSEDPEDAVTNPGHGDYYVKVTELADGSYERIAYIYDEEKSGWVVLDGNVDAEHVIINKDITLSGNYTTIGNMNRGDVVKAGTTVKKLFDDILALEVYPSTLAATYTFSSANAAPTLYVYNAGTTTAAASSIEVGTLVDTKATFGSQSATEKVVAATFNNGTDKGYATDKSGTGYTAAESYTQTLTSDVTSDTTTSKLTVKVGGVAAADSSTSNYNDAATISNIIILEGANKFDASQSAITYTRNWANLTEQTLYAKSNIGGYSDDHKVTISKTDAESATSATVKAGDKTAAQKTVTGYWPIYWGYVTESKTTFKSTTFTVEWIQSNYTAKKSSFVLPQELSTLNPGTKECYGIWVAIPADQAAATADWSVVNKATAAPINMADDTKVSVKNMTSSVSGTTYTGTKNYTVQYWVNSDYDYAANTYTISKA